MGISRQVFSLFVAATVACSAVALAKPSFSRTRGADSDNCIECPPQNNGCAVCTGRVTDATNIAMDIITVDLSGCKNGNTISWLSCCRDAAQCKITSCLGASSALSDDAKKCDETSGASFQVSKTASTLTLHLHDGKFASGFNANFGAGADNTCGGPGTSCSAPAVSGVCIQDLDLSKCPNVTPPPECDGDSDCTGTPTSSCSEAYCNDDKQCAVRARLADFVCRPAAGVCDQSETCDGVSHDCPSTDIYLPATTVCRPATDLCDKDDYCTGTGPACSADQVQAGNYECRRAADKCDVPEVCDGISKTCPTDLRKDHGYTYKCSTTQFTCVVTVDDLASGAKDTFFLGSCGIGVGKVFQALQWPECTTQCLSELCPNNRGLSNYALAHCDRDTGEWVCDGKYDITAATIFDANRQICPVW